MNCQKFGIEKCYNCEWNLGIYHCITKHHLELIDINDTSLCAKDCVSFIKAYGNDRMYQNYLANIKDIINKIPGLKDKVEKLLILM